MHCYIIGGNAKGSAALYRGYLNSPLTNIKKKMRRSFTKEVTADLRMIYKKPNIILFIKSLLISVEFQLIFLYRVRQCLLNIPFIGRYLANILRILTCVWTSCHIDLETEIEGGVAFVHATGIVIGAKLIKSGTVIYQNVTIGSKDSDRNKHTRDGKPIIGKNVCICAGAVVLSNIGRNSVVGANAVVAEDVPDNCLAIGIPAIARPLKK